MEGSSSEPFTVPASFEALFVQKNDAADEYVALKEQLERLVLAQQIREKHCATALADLQSQYGSIIQQAKDEAARILAAAHAEASIIAANSAALEVAAKKSTEEAELKAKQIIDNAKSAAQTIIGDAEEVSTNLREKASEECVTMRAVVTREQVEWKEEQALVANVQKFLPIVKLNVGGNRFDTSLTTMTRFRDTMIGTMFNGKHTIAQDTEGYHFIDRDGTHFRYILNFLRSPETFEVNLPEAALKELQSECKYYGLFEAMFPSRLMKREMSEMFPSRLMKSEMSEATKAFKDNRIRFNY